MSLLMDYLPAIESGGGRARHLCLKSRLQELTAFLALPLSPMSERMSDFERHRVVKSVSASFKTLEWGLKNFQKWDVPADGFSRLTVRVNNLLVGIAACEEEIFRKWSRDDDWPEFTERILSRFADFAEEVKEIAKEVDGWHIEVDPAFDGDDADSCNRLFRTYPRKESLPVDPGNGP